MVTKFSASEARQTVEIAKQQAKKQAELDKRHAELEQQANEARKRDEDALREKQARIQEVIDQGWAAQKTLIIDAAVDRKKELTLRTPIYNFINLIDVGIDFIEVGWVRNQEVETNEDLYTDKEYESRNAKIRRQEEGVRVLGRELMQTAHADWRKYYGSIEKYVESINRAVDEAIESTSDDFDGEYILWVNVPVHLRRKYSTHFLHMTHAIKFLKKSRQNPLYGLPKRVKKKREETIYGEYLFSDRDQKVEILGEPHEFREDDDGWVDEDQNHYKVKWISEETPELMSEPLFSKHGLNWISGEYGQNLLEAIFDCLKGAAAKGKSTTSIKFKLTSDGWYFVNDSGYHYPSCMPDDLVEIIARQDFIIADTSATSRSYTIKLKW